MVRVLHLAGRLRPGGSGGTLWPTVVALAHTGAAQCLMALDPCDADQVEPLLPQGAAIDPAGGTAGLRQHLAAGAVTAVHLHGVPAALLGGIALRGAADVPSVFLHLGPQARPTLALRLMRGLKAPLFLVTAEGTVPVVRESRRAARASRAAIDPCLFQLVREEAAEPLIVTTAHPDDIDYAQEFVQLAVMLSGIGRMALSFGWVGEAPEALLPMFKAARITVLPGATPAERAQVFGRAWLYVAPDLDGRDARGVAEAMAAGLPCVTRRVSAYRRLIPDTLSGSLCRRREDMLCRIAELIEQPDSAAQRRALGQAARLRCRQQHGRDRFRASLLLAHGRSPRLTSTVTGPG